MLTEEKIKEILYTQFLKDSVHFFDDLIIEKLENLIKAGYEAAVKECGLPECEKCGTRDVSMEVKKRGNFDMILCYTCWCKP